MVSSPGSVSAMMLMLLIDKLLSIPGPLSPVSTESSASASARALADSESSFDGLAVPAL